MERLRLPRKTFYDKLTRHGIKPAEFAWIAETIAANSGDEGKLFGSIGTRDIDSTPPAITTSCWPDTTAAAAMLTACWLTWMRHRKYWPSRFRL